MKKVVYITISKNTISINGIIESDGTKEVAHYIIKDNVPILLFTDELDISENSIDDTKQILIAELYKDEDSTFYSEELIDYIGDTDPKEIEVVEL